MCTSILLTTAKQVTSADHDAACMHFSTIWPTSQGVAASCNSCCLRHNFSRHHPCSVLASSSAGSGRPLHCRVWSHANFSACNGGTPVCGRDVQTFGQQLSATAVLYVVGFYCYMFRSMYKEPSSERLAQQKLQSATPNIHLPCPYLWLRSQVTIVTKFVTNKNVQTKHYVASTCSNDALESALKQLWLKLVNCYFQVGVWTKVSDVRPHRLLYLTSLIRCVLI